MSRLGILSLSKSDKPDAGAAREAASSDSPGTLLPTWYRISDRGEVIGVVVGV